MPSRDSTPFTGFSMSSSSSIPPYHVNLTSRPFCHSAHPSVFSTQTSAPPDLTPASKSSLCTQHRFTLRGTKENARPWLSLLLASRSPRPEFLPLFVGKDAVSGFVELDLSKPDTIREVKIMVCPSLFIFYVAARQRSRSSRERVPTLPKDRTLLSSCHRHWQRHRESSQGEYRILSISSFQTILLSTSPTGPWCILFRQNFKRKGSCTSTTGLW